MNSFGFNQNYEWFSSFNKPGGFLGSASAGKFTRFEVTPSDRREADWSKISSRVDSFLNDAVESHVYPQAVFGSNGSVLCWSNRSNGRLGQPRTAARWSADQKARMDGLLLNRWTGFADVAIHFAALGARGAYFIKFDDDMGTVKSDFRGCYPALQRYLDKIGRRSVQVRHALPKFGG